MKDCAQPGGTFILPRAIWPWPVGAVAVAHCGIDLGAALVPPSGRATSDKPFSGQNICPLAHAYVDSPGALISGLTGTLPPFSTELETWPIQANSWRQY